MSVLRENKKLLLAATALAALVVLGAGVFLLNSSGDSGNEEPPKFAIEKGTPQAITLQNTGGPVNGGVQIQVPIGNETFYGNFTRQEVERDEFFSVNTNQSADNVSSIGTIQVFKTQNGELESQINAITIANISQ